MHIGLVGFKSSGKDTVANTLVKQFGYYPIAFADAIKDCLASVFCWDRSALEGITPEDRHWRELVDPWWAQRLGVPQFSPRWAMTNFGTDLMRRNFDDRIWILNTERRIDLYPDRNFVIKDGRFANEIDALRRRNAKIVRVKRGDDPAWFGIAREANQGCGVARATMERLDVHVSEWAWVGSEIDVTIENDGTFSQLAKKVEDMFVV